jgi:hypothetical protein
MSDQAIKSAAEESAAHISLKEFLERVHPSIVKMVSGAWKRQHSSNGTSVHLNTPELRLHCAVCDGERTFRSEDDPFLRIDRPNLRYLDYRCGDCQKHVKTFSLWVRTDDEGAAHAYKYGEKPAFGIPVPNRVLRLFGKDRANFIKGRQCENQGLGVGAFAYYRRVVENHKNEIFEEIIRVCETINASGELIEELRRAQKEISFEKSLAQIKTALPQGLLIDGNNPLLALHGALSVGLHQETDEDCLEAAHAVRLVLTDLVDKMSMLRQDNQDLNKAVQRLLDKRSKS